MFFNTGITTYIWIVSNKKSKEREGKVQLIDGSSFSTSMRKNLGDKGKEISQNQIDHLFGIYQNYEEGEYSKIFANQFFGYTKVTIEQPLIENSEVKIDKKGNYKIDTSKRDFERIPLKDNIDIYFEKEVKPHLQDAWMDRSKDKIGYEINFNKIFYKFNPPRHIKNISESLKLVEEEIRVLSSEINFGK